MLDDYEVDPEQIGSLYLNTLAAPSLQNNATNHSNTYGWYVDWTKVIGEPDPTAIFQVEHEFQGGWGYLLAIPSANLNVFLGFSTQCANGVTQNTLTCTLPLDQVNNQLSGNSTNTYNMNQNNVFNYINYDFQNAAAPSNVYLFYYPNARKNTFRCGYPGDSPFIQITAYATNSAQHFGNATNSYATTSDYFHSGVHKFTFKRLRPKMRIPKAIDPEVIGTLSLMTTAANATSFDPTTQTQTYTWYNIQWNQVIGHLNAPSDAVWEVTHKWESNAMVSQSINTVLGFPPNPQTGTPFFPVIFIGCSMQGNNSTPSIGNCINTIYCKLQQELTQSSWYQFLINTFCDESKFVVTHPENNSSLTIVTRPSFAGSYTSNTATTSQVITAAPADYYTNGTHFFTFRLLKNKDF